MAGFGRIAVIADFAILRRNGKTITWKPIQSWITEHSNQDLFGVGDAGGKLGSLGSDPYADVRKETKAGKIQVTASIVFSKAYGAVASKTWAGDKLDSKLEKMFGNNLRFRIKV